MKLTPFYTLYKTQADKIFIQILYDLLEIYPPSGLWNLPSSPPPGSDFFEILIQIAPIKEAFSRG